MARVIYRNNYSIFERTHIATTPVFVDKHSVAEEITQQID